VRTASIVYVIGAIVPSASAFAAIRSALHGFEPGPLAVTRFVFASVFLLLFCAPAAPFADDGRRGPHRDCVAVALRRLQPRAQLRRAACHAGAAGLLIATAPLFTALVAAAPGERLSLVAWLGAIVGFAGAAVIALAGGEGVGSGLAEVCAVTVMLSISRSLHPPHGLLDRR
jgi:hypothetical protein